jgi:glycosyltransferase involved in cell wall biosynthesis
LSIYKRCIETRRARIRELRLANVTLTGGVPHSRVGEYIARMDVCLNVFKKIDVAHSACPIKLFEYLIMKKPVISTRLKEVERIDRYFIFYADTVDEFVRSIQMILDNRPLAADYARRGYETILRKYNWAIAARQLLGYIEDVRRNGGKRMSGPAGEFQAIRTIQPAISGVPV